MIKKTITYILLSLLAATLLALISSCGRMPINGKLDGHWRIVKIIHKGELKYNTTDEYLPEYMGIQLEVVQLRSRVASISGNLVYSHPEVHMDFPRELNEAGVLRLRDFGIYENPITFHVEKLDSKRLVLSADDTVVEYERF